MGNSDIATYPYDTATFSSAPTVLRSVTAVGFHTGVDLATYLTPTVGVGALVRFSRAMVDLARPDGGGMLAVETGGLHVGGWSAPTILIGTHGPVTPAQGPCRRDRTH